MAQGSVRLTFFGPTRPMVLADAHVAEGRNGPSQISELGPLYLQNSVVVLLDLGRMISKAGRL